MGYYPLASYKRFGKSRKARRSVQRLNETERKILEFLVEKFNEVPDGYHTYSNDPKLKAATGKSQEQLSRALRRLHSWKFGDQRLLESSRGGKPVLYWIEPENVDLVRRVLAGDGYISAVLLLNWARRQMGWFTTRDVAKLFNVSKRHAQKLVKILVDKGLIRRVYLTGKGNKGRVVYVEAEGQLPLDHFIRSFDRSYDVLSNIKWRIYKTQNPFI